VSAPLLLVSRCESCTLRYLPRAGPCPRCGSLQLAPFSVPPIGRVLAATELMSPSAGWTPPHRLALLELAQSVRVLVIVEGDLPTIGSTLEVSKDGDAYRARAW
jgi:uncharacterized OB-fold protein